MRLPPSQIAGGVRQRNPQVEASRPRVRGRGSGIFCAAMQSVRPAIITRYFQNSCQEQVFWIAWRLTPDWPGWPSSRRLWLKSGQGHPLGTAFRQSSGSC